MRTAAYWSEFAREAVAPGFARELPDYGVMELLAPVRMQIAGKEKSRKGEWRERTAAAEYLPGQVLRREWREALEWEAQEWSLLPPSQLEALGVFRRGEGFSVQIVEKITDLPAMIRQRARHVVASKIARTRRQFTLAGDAELLAQYSARLDRLTRQFLQRRAIPSSATQELAALGLLLESKRARLVRSAREEMALAHQGRFWEAPAKTAQASAYLLQERARSYEIASQTLRLAERLLQLTESIERRFRNCYVRLGKLGELLQESLRNGNVPAQQIFSIAREAQGIYQHLSNTENVPNFNPYYERLRAPEFQRLSRAAEHASQGRVETLYNDIAEAAAKLEAVALRERPTRAEMARQRTALL